MQSQWWRACALLLAGLPVGLVACTSPTLPSPGTTQRPLSAVFATEYQPSTPADNHGWEVDTSGHGDTAAVAHGVLVCTAGGFQAESHYARVRRKFPEVDGRVVRGSFTMTEIIELPTNFYAQAESYVRFMNTDNFRSTIRGTSTVVGPSSGADWRVGFLMYGSDHLPRLESDHDGHSKITLWVGTSRLPVGRNTIVVQFTPSQSSTGSFAVWINGTKVAGRSGVKTVPTTIPPSEVIVTRIVGGIDGASKQTAQPLTVWLRSLSFRAG